MASLSRDQLLDLLERVGHQEDSEIDLADTALLLAALDQPDTDLALYRRHLDKLVADVRAEATTDTGKAATHVDARLNVLRTVLYDTHGYAGDKESFDNPKNANLVHVIDRKKGLPVALGILCLHAAEGAGWDMAGLNFPSHFLLRLEAPPERAILDPFDRCADLDAVAIRARLKDMLGEGAEFQPSYFEPVTKRAILLRLQNNIKLRALHTDDTDKALAVLNAMALVAPHAQALFAERAMLFAHRGELTTAIRTLAGFLEREQAALQPPEDDFADLKALLRNLRSSLN